MFLMISAEMSWKDFGNVSPEILADVDTKGPSSFWIISRQNGSKVTRIPMVPSSESIPSNDRQRVHCIPSYLYLASTMTSSTHQLTCNPA